jgi:hypothetical protein
MQLTIQSVAMLDATKRSEAVTILGRMSSMESYEVKYRAQKQRVAQRAVKEEVQKVGA